MSLFSFTPTPHPFQNKKTNPVVIPEGQIKEEDVIETTWGNNQIVKVKHKSSVASEEWEIKDNSKTKLKPVDLDEFDLHVIRQKGLNYHNYKLVKPFIVTTDKFTNNEIALSLNKSLSWVERLAPRIKDAMKLRSKKG